MNTGLLSLFAKPKPAVAAFLALALSAVPLPGPAQQMTSQDKELVQASESQPQVRVGALSGHGVAVDVAKAGTYLFFADSRQLLDRPGGAPMPTTSKDGPIRVSTTSVLFDSSNLKTGVVINVDNESGLNQTLAIELPRNGLLFSWVVRKPEQTRVRPEKWDRFTIRANSGIFIALLPDNDPAQIKMLDGKEIVVKVYQGNQVRETHRIAIKVGLDRDTEQGSPSMQSKPFQGKTKLGTAMEATAGTSRALIAAAKQGDLPRVQQLLGQGADVNAKDRDGRTALTVAAERGDFDVMKKLLDSGAEVSAKDRNDETALVSAARKGRVEAVKLLLEKGADRNALDRNYMTPLNVAAARGDLKMVRLLLAKSGKVGPTREDYITTLFPAAAGGHARVVRFLLQNGADVNVKGKDGWTALMSAAATGNQDVARLLLEKGSDVNSETEGGVTALMWAAENGWPELVKVLLDHGANVNAKDTGGWTALMSGAAKGNPRVVDLLLDKGANVNARSKQPFWSMRAREPAGKGIFFWGLTEFLKEEGESGWTALMSAAAEGHVDVVKALLRVSADVNAQSRFDWTAMKVARKRSHKEIEELLKAAGAKE